MASVLCQLLFVLSVFSAVNGHGRLLDPVSRSSAWRKNIPGAVTNYNDNQLFCGGSNRQWATNGGKCGVCGDPWDGPRDNEAGGKYARGIITGIYTQGGDMDLHVQLTAYHKGWFEFRLCANDDVTRPVTQECLDANLLNVMTSKGRTTRFDINGNKRRDYYLKAELPGNLVCQQCVLQWKYNTGNSWGVDPDTGRGCVGCGPQEQFYGCSDVTIQANGDIPISPSTSADPGATPANTVSSATGITPSVENRETPAATDPVATSKPQPEVTTTERPKRSECRAVSEWTGGDVLDRWCSANCELGFCPSFLCTCAHEPEDRSAACKATGPWTNDTAMDQWCRLNCAQNYCPPTHCVCV